MLTAGVMIVLGLTSLAVALTDSKPYVHLQFVPHMTKYHQVRVFGAQLTAVLADTGQPVGIYELERGALG